ncbi:hypothetical protein ACEQPO_10530 [Bacillus sp. SL00103]
MIRNLNRLQVPLSRWDINSLEVIAEGVETLHRRDLYLHKDVTTCKAFIMQSPFQQTISKNSLPIQHINWTHKRCQSWHLFILSK